MTDLASSGNLVEAVLWFLFAGAFSFLAWRTRSRKRRLFAVLAPAFVLFGCSDLIEARTGAWWRPIWLLLLKAGCVGVFVYGIWEYLRIQKSEDGQPAPPDHRLLP
jgi:CHASE2 domain-containing sensor protein